MQLYFSRVSPDYFEVLDIPIIRGRGFRRSENGARDQVLIVSESTSRHLWPGVDQIGKRIRIGDEKVYRKVVGVARDIYATNVSEVDGIYIYRPVDPRELRLSVRVRGKESASVAKQLHAVVAKLDPNVFVDGVELKENLKTGKHPRVS